ncbi:4-hydroxybenzoate 3-monooxygenase [Actinosynnema sp. NPDC047251]|uniref:p-hydroxybenzoate hydroxylase n=1 Tax=Saccharothrix espanaensis (strain ATCC 51144 / DSM 44229 / JCM 9112 / NBRC 15066 / NRRL 15764) TaxID=1179773 RepID=K0JZA2_SACES|nr:4-hydroxybenzoate 3-monooxygenase [Saccharothrix espanaensis]CCH31456.1 P-hydroxybenzoate hydroxylase [Saccharothrix espanaensis DSM 44229]
MRTQVAIVGAGPAGLLLSHLLSLRGVDSVVVENRSRAYVEARIRAGVLEQDTVDLLVASGLGDRLREHGMRHDGIHLQWPGERHRIDFRALTGRSVWIYGQTEVVKDLLGVRGDDVWFEVTDTALHDVDTDRPRLSFVDAEGTPRVVQADVVVGADGFHGVSRPTIPAGRAWEREYPYAWLGILAEVPPSTDELIYAWHPRGFAMHSMRSPRLSRLYLQVAPGERVEDWSDDRIWDELGVRLGLDGWSLGTGPIVDKGVTPMRSFVSTPMRHGRLFLVGDAAHIVPPTGAKGLNLAVADVAVLTEALGAFFAEGRTDLLDGYEDRALRRVWRCTHFSWWMTSMLHTSGDELDQQLQLAQLAYVCSSEAAATSLAENYVGLPHDTGHTA